MVIGSSGRPAPVISWMSALPMDVTRSETCVSLPSMSACGGTDVTGPSHQPARVFILSKDFCASDFFSSVWAKTLGETHITTTDSTKPLDLNDSISCLLK